MSSKEALSILVKAVSSRAFVPIVLHMDTTYKLNINEFLVLITVSLLTLLFLGLIEFCTMQCGHQEGPLELQKFDKVFLNALCTRYTCATPAEHTASFHAGLS
jgi:hypothetical protein